jgi:hypothetical protein
MRHAEAAIAHGQNDAVALTLAGFTIGMEGSKAAMLIRPALWAQRGCLSATRDRMSAAGRKRERRATFVARLLISQLRIGPP